MGKVLITLRVMPESPDADLDELKKTITTNIESEQGKNIRFEEQPIAFGLNALMTFFMLDESQELEPIENKIQEIPDVSSCQVTDMRRAIG